MPPPLTVSRVLAVDIGGTKLAAGLVEAHSGRILRRVMTPTPRSDDAEVVFGALVGLFDELGPEWRSAEVCGIGSGGPMTAGGEELTPVHIPAWQRFPLRRRMEEATGRPTFVDNDAKAVALAEGWVGAAAGVGAYIGMVVSTGIGGGIVLDGRLLDGQAGNAGHIGHVVVEPEGRTCFCGGRGCLEGEASGRAIEAITGRPPAEAPRDVIERAGRLVGRAVASVANLLDLDLAVVAGSVALGFGDRFFAAAQAEVDVLARLEFSRGARIRPAGLGGDAPLIGAAAVAVYRLGGLPQCP
ncbi:MAG TPA: ROK family protein [Acidimicrobiia bacterium]|nr:ROK family protein [Acidimicrobiia bacterium]